MPAIINHNLLRTRVFTGTGLVPIRFPLYANVILLGGLSRKQQGTKSK